MLNGGKGVNLSIENMLRLRLIIFLLLPVILMSFFTQYNLVFAATPTLKIVKPTNGAVISGFIVEVKFEVANFVLKDYRNNPKPVSGQGHLNLWLDKEEIDGTTAQKWFRDIPYTFADVSSGNHILVVELTGNDNEPLNPRVTQKVEFTTVSDSLEKDNSGSRMPTGLSSSSKDIVNNTTTPVPPINGLSRMRLPVIVGIAALFFGVLGSLILRN